MEKQSISFQIQSFGISDLGLVRERNEDYWAANSDKNIYALADGMGGHLGGDVAAKEAVKFSLDLLSNSEVLARNHLRPSDVLDVMRFVIQQANARVYEKSKIDPKVKGMGTTLCCFYLYGGRYAVYAHVGDSRIYRLRSGILKQLTCDHSIMQEMVNSGEISCDQERLLAKRKYGGVITKAVGIDARVRAEADFEEVHHEDLYLMCSDGLSNTLTTENIQGIIESTTSINVAAKSLIEAAKNAGGSDNITALLLACKEDK